MLILRSDFEKNLSAFPMEDTEKSEYSLKSRMLASSRTRGQVADSPGRLPSGSAGRLHTRKKRPDT